MNNRLALAIVFGAIAGPAFPADTYIIDPAHAPAHFDIARVGFSAQRGSFIKSGKSDQLTQPSSVCAAATLRLNDDHASTPISGIRSP